MCRRRRHGTSPPATCFASCSGTGSIGSHGASALPRSHRTPRAHEPRARRGRCTAGVDGREARLGRLQYRMDDLQDRDGVTGASREYHGQLHRGLLPCLRSCAGIHQLAGEAHPATAVEGCHACNVGVMHRRARRRTAWRTRVARDQSRVGLHSHLEKTLVRDSWRSPRSHGTTRTSTSPVFSHILRLPPMAR